MSDMTLIKHLTQERKNLAGRLAAIDNAIAALKAMDEIPDAPRKQRRPKGRKPLAHKRGWAIAKENGGLYRDRIVAALGTDRLDRRALVERLGLPQVEPNLARISNALNLCHKNGLVARAPGGLWFVVKPSPKAGRVVIEG